MLRKPVQYSLKEKWELKNGITNDEPLSTKRGFI